MFSVTLYSDTMRLLTYEMQKILFLMYKKRLISFSGQYVFNNKRYFNRCMMLLEKGKWVVRKTNGIWMMTNAGSDLVEDLSDLND